MELVRSKTNTPRYQNLSRKSFDSNHWWKKGKAGATLIPKLKLKSRAHLGRTHWHSTLSVWLSLSSTFSHFISPLFISFQKTCETSSLSFSSSFFHLSTDQVSTIIFSLILPFQFIYACSLFWFLLAFQFQILEFHFLWLIVR